MSSDYLVSHRFSVLLSTRPERQTTWMPVACATAGHVIVVSAVMWLTQSLLPSSIVPAHQVAYETGERLISMLLVAPEPAKKMSSLKQGSLQLKHGNIPEVPIVNEIELPEKGSSSAMVDAADFTHPWADLVAPSSNATATASADTADLAAGPRYTAYTRAPNLKNRAQVQALLESRFPGKLRRSGGEARAVVWLLIDAHGDVLKSILHETSGSAEADSVAVQSSYDMKFDPAEQAGRPVPVWVQIPVRFRVIDTFASQ